MEKGVDVSKFQGGIDWGNVAKNGYTFAIPRAVMGATGHDATFGVNAHGAENAGLETFAYGFAYPRTSSAVAEADSLVTVANHVGNIHMLVLDVEGAGVPSSVSRSNLTQYILDWAARIHSHGYTPAVYMSTYFIRSRVYASQLGHLILWQAEYGVSSPTVVDGWHPTFWQHTSKGHVAGIRGNVDLDIFYGTLHDLRNIKGGKGVSTRLLKLTKPLMNGSDVKTIQEDLNKILGVSMKVDGFYGPKTVGYVKKFQLHYGLGVDGEVGPKTRAKIDAVLKQDSKPTPAPTPAPSPAPSTPPQPSPQPDTQQLEKDLQNSYTAVEKALADAKNLQSSHIQQLEQENTQLKSEKDAIQKQFNDYKSKAQSLADQIKSL